MHKGITKCPSLLVPKGSRNSKVKIIPSLSSKKDRGPSVIPINQNPTKVEVKIKVT